ncbi:MAG: hypothetical protein OQL09_00185 [Gammaproteobacteria bacterium]|nr:hypothetical protein [Gammaproteobacteria bacterium]
MPAVSKHALDYLDELTERLYVPVVTHHHGAFELRCLGVLDWRSSLLNGVLPDSNMLNWPLLPERKILIEKLQASSLVQHCKNRPATTEQVLLDILAWLDNEEHDFMPEDDRPESDFKDQVDNGDESKEQQPEQNNNVSSEAAAEYQQQALDQTDPESDQSLDEFDWHQQSQRLDQIDDLMKDYAVLHKLGSDLSKGLLVKTQWKDIFRLHKEIKHSQYLKKIISLIGRGDQLNADPSDLLEHRKKSSFPENKQQRIHFTHHAPMEASGITRSDDIGRMLPNELSALGHKTLKRLWHVKRAERMLLSYQYEGVLSEHLPSYEIEVLKPDKDGKKQVDSTGPMIIALDTSASMKGHPEHVAKAIVLETMRVASRESRPCLLLAFSGPDQIHEYELTSSELGWHALLDVISLSFHGGTDITSVVEQACSMVQQKTWRLADLLLVSDSRFQVDDKLVKDVQVIKTDFGMRLHAINVSSWNSQAMEKLCQPVHRITKL